MLQNGGFSAHFRLSEGRERPQSRILPNLRPAETRPHLRHSEASEARLPGQYPLFSRNMESNAFFSEVRFPDPSDSWNRPFAKDSLGWNPSWTYPKFQILTTPHSTDSAPCCVRRRHKKLFKFFSHLFLCVRSFGVFLPRFPHFARHLAPLNSSQNKKI